MAPKYSGDRELFFADKYYGDSELFSICRSWVIQVLRHTVGGRVSDFPEKSATEMLVQRY